MLINFYNVLSLFRSRYVKPLYLLLLTLGVSTTCYGVSISTQRIYLDQNNGEERFVIINNEQKIQSCKLGLTHYTFDNNGHLLEYKDGQQPQNSAKSLLRYSPRQFDIQAASRQTVRFVMRRKANVEAKEYRSYLVVTCEDKIKEKLTNTREDDVVKISMKPLLVHNVPIIVRPKQITNTKVTLQNIQFNDGKLNFDVVREGDRSVYGKIEVINQANGELITESNSFSLYTETTRKNLLLTVNSNINPNQWLIRFTEDKHYGGTLVAEITLGDIQSLTSAQ